jgi:hypothetical protein
MKTIAKSSFVLALALALLTPGCKKAEPPATDASQMLQQAFETAEPAVKESIASVVTNLKAKNYTEVAKALDQIVSKRQVTEEQKQAIMTAVLQIGEAIATDPKINTPELSALRAKIFETLRRSSR